MPVGRTVKLEPRGGKYAAALSQNVRPTVIMPRFEDRHYILAMTSTSVCVGGCVERPYLHRADLKSRSIAKSPLLQLTWCCREGAWECCDNVVQHIA
jgi:hypothetical protein